MPEHIDDEIEAIKVVLNALEPLPSGVRESVLRYVTQRLQIQIPSTTSLVQAPAGHVITESETKTGTPVHIKELKLQKKPRSANEMAALTAYFLANIVPSPDRKEKVTTRDIETYFKIAEYPLPEKTQFTLPNAKAAGYLDAVGNGEYKLNAVGHNLVVHSMPRGADGTVAARRRPARKSRNPKK